MQFRYSLMRKSLSACTKHAAVVAGLVILPITAKLEKIGQAKTLRSVTPSPDVAPTLKPAADPRTVCLRKFLARLHCPVTNLSEDFVHAADDNQLDWRLLPSISVIESGGGKAYRNNNIFGWNNGAQLFPTIRAGLNEVAFRLGKSPLYRHQDLLGKLKLYNPDETYASSVINVMNRISPVVNLKPARRLERRQTEFVYVTD